MTHIDNIVHILKYGITHKNSANANPDFISIGDKSLIDTREHKRVIVNNGDLFNNGAAITLGDYIPFYFGVKMPMLYVVQNGGNFVEQPTKAESIIYLACHLSQIVASDLTYYFCDGHATDNFTTFYDKKLVKELTTLIDWNAIKAQYWGGNENLNLKRKKQAEFLVAEDLPPDYIANFGCYSEVAKNKLVDMGIADSKIKVIKNCYF